MNKSFSKLRWPCIALIFLCLLAAAWFFYIFAPTADEKRLLEIQPGTTRKLSSIFQVPDRDDITVCALQPYSGKIQIHRSKDLIHKGHQVPLNVLTRINEYLLNRKIRAREGEWVFIFAQKDGYIFTRSISRRHANFKIPIEFNDFCLPIHVAAIRSVAGNESLPPSSSQFILTTKE
jgi:hypothetical protein